MPTNSAKEHLRLVMRIVRSVKKQLRVAQKILLAVAWCGKMRNILKCSWLMLNVVPTMTAVHWNYGIAMDPDKISFAPLLCVPVDLDDGHPNAALP